LTSSKPTSKNFVESLATNPSKIRKITLATLIVAVSLSVAIEIGYATSLIPPRQIHTNKHCAQERYKSYLKKG
jgi:hypothetical protein